MSWQDEDERRDIIPVIAFGKLGECIMTHVRPGDVLEVMATPQQDQSYADVITKGCTLFRWICHASPT